MLEIWIYNRKTPDAPVKVWPSAGPIPSGLISEACEYVVEARGADVADLDLTIDEIPLLALRSKSEDTASWLWAPGFYAGFIEFRLSRKDLTVWTGQITLDPNAAKLSRDEFDQMVREILSDTYALFSISSARKGVGRGPGGQTPPIARLEFLRSRLIEIEKAVREIDKSPVRILTSTQSRVAPGKPVSVTSADLARSFRTEQLRQVPASSPLAKHFNGLFPGALRITQRRVNLDIGEHRAIKAELKTWAAWLMVVAQNIDGTPQQGEDEKGARLRRIWAIRCRAMARAIHRLRALPVFADVADVNQPMTLTSVFRWAAPYRKFFRLSSDFRSGIAKIGGDFLNIPISRTFELYELWAFLRLARCGVGLFGTKGADVSTLFETASQDAVTIASSSVAIKLAPQLYLCFKRSYKEYWLAKAAGSFSREMIPDISILADTRAPCTLIVLDAKYRVDQQLNDAVGTLHTYRDAIVQEQAPGSLPNRVVSGAYIVTPHLPSLEIVEGRNPWEQHTLPGLLFHPKYKSTFNFGAVTLKPGMTDAQLEALLKQILLDVGIPVP